MHRDTVAFFYFSLVNPRLIHCAALLLDLDMITLRRNSKFKEYKMFIITTRFFEDLAQTDTIFLEAVEQAQFVFCYHARVPYLWSDGTPDAVSHSVGNMVSGAADQVGECLLLEFRR